MSNTKVPYYKAKLVDGELVLGEPQIINPHKCPHLILVGEHYRTDGSCKCNDPNETVMTEWGYVWSDTTKRWESPPEDD